MEQTPEEIKAEIEQLTVERDALKQERDDLLGRKDQLNDSIQRKEKRHRDLHTEGQAIESNHLRILKQNDDISTENTRLSTETQQIQAEHDRVLREHTAFDQKYSNAKGHYEGLVNASDELERTHAIRMATLETEHTRKVAELNSELDALKSQRLTRTNEITTLETQKAELEGFIQENTEKHDELKTSVDTLTDQKNALQEELNDLEGKVSKLAPEAAQRQIEADRQLAETNAELAQAKSELDAKNKEISARSDTLFRIADKEKILDQREGFIKERYQTAGVPYEPTT